MSITAEICYDYSNVAGTIHRIVQFVEERRGAFAVSRLIMMTGVRVRLFDPSSEDHPGVLEKMKEALPLLLSKTELQELDQGAGHG